MRELIADMFISLDGFASGTNEAAYFGYFGDDLGNWVHEQLDEHQVMLMGRVTYEALAAFAMSATDEVSTRMRTIPKLVYSNTLHEPLAWNNTGLISGNLRLPARRHSDRAEVAGRDMLTKFKTLVRQKNGHPKLDT